MFREGASKAQLDSSISSMYKGSHFPVSKVQTSESRLQEYYHTLCGSPMNHLQKEHSIYYSKVCINYI